MRFYLLWLERETPTQYKEEGGKHNERCKVMSNLTEKAKRTCELNVLEVYIEE